MHSSTTPGKLTRQGLLFPFKDGKPRLRKRFQPMGAAFQSSVLSKSGDTMTRPTYAKDIRI